MRFPTPLDLSVHEHSFSSISLLRRDRKEDNRLPWSIWGDNPAVRLQQREMNIFILRDRRFISSLLTEQRGVLADQKREEASYFFPESSPFFAHYMGH
ncbi:hypothetical protein CC2G_003291 [Coprinopsis cinerea AmutBmut pab1-1]|nr:hypothetical protein CC2G_003291 [Coprinopsis cinerea AmutBmut pab1-1]